MSVLYIIHNIYPAGQADNLHSKNNKIDITLYVTLRHVTKTHERTKLGANSFARPRTTYHNQRRKIYPRPERLSILNIIHYIYPALETDHLPINTQHRRGECVQRLGPSERKFLKTKS